MSDLRSRPPQDHNNRPNVASLSQSPVSRMKQHPLYYLFVYTSANHALCFLLTLISLVNDFEIRIRIIASILAFLCLETFVISINCLWSRRPMNGSLCVASILLLLSVIAATASSLAIHIDYQNQPDKFHPELFKECVRKYEENCWKLTWVKSLPNGQAETIMPYNCYDYSSDCALLDMPVTPFLAILPIFLASLSAWFAAIVFSKRELPQ